MENPRVAALDPDEDPCCHHQASEGPGEAMPDLDRDSCYEISEHSHKIMKGLHTLWQNKQLCDVILRVSGHAVHAHRAVLSSGSPYFFAMFAGSMCETAQSEVELQSVDKDALEALVGYIYTGNIHISHSNVQALLATADLIQMKDVKQLCCDFLEQHLDTSNCLGITQFAEVHACDDWAATARKYCAQNFEALKYTEEFLHLDFVNLRSLLMQEDLAVPCEESVLEMLMVWVQFDPGHRSGRLGELLECIKLPQLMLTSLQRHLENNELVWGNPSCREQFQRTIQYHLSVEGRTERRVASPYAYTPRQDAKIMCAIGGKNGLFATLKSFEVCESPQAAWAESTPLNCRRQECAAAVVNRCLYVIGGIKCFTRNGTTFRRHDNSMEKWCPETNQWTPVAKMSKCRSNHGVAVLNGNIYAMGGYDGQFYLKSVEVYSTIKDEWVTVAPMTKSRSIFSAATLDGKVYALGGYGPNYLSSVERFLPDKNVWQMMTPMTHPRINFGAAVLDNFIYVVGGHDGATNLKSVERYDAHQNKWYHVTSMNQARTGLGVGVLEGCIYAAGGHSGSVYLKEVERYSPVDECWIATPSMNNCRCNFAFTSL